MSNTAVLRGAAWRGVESGPREKRADASAMIRNVCRGLLLWKKIGWTISGVFMKMKCIATLLFGPIHGRIGVLQ